MEPEDKNNWKQFQGLGPKKKLLRRKAKKLEVATIRHAHKFLIHRWENIRDVRRHVLGWLLLVAILIAATGMQITWGQSLYLKDAQDSGGTYAEGAIGPLDTLNPLYVSTSAERSASRLVFASLLSYDQNNHLRGDLAQDWTIKDKGSRYIVYLRPGLTWHDGAPITSRDVVHTVNLIKNPDTRSSMTNSWQSIEVQALDERTIQFTLPSAYAPFLHALTVGILPEHKLKNVEPSSLRENSFSTNPVGSGPFALRNIQNINTEQGRKVVHLRAFSNYFRGAPKLERFQLHTYENADQLRRALVSNEVSAITDLPVQDVNKIDEKKFSIIDAPLNNGMFALFKTDSSILKDVNVRRAIWFGTSMNDIRQELHNRVKPLMGPILSSQLGKSVPFEVRKYNPAKANAMLNQLGWKRASDGIRVKDGRQLKVSLVSLNTGDYPTVVNKLKEQWQQIGVLASVELVEPDDVQQSTLRPRAFDVLVYELALGADPDVYAYWHSSQIGQNGLNFADYDSPVADDALESARTRMESKLRREKYMKFVSQWFEDAPAIPLYRTGIHYATAQNVRAFDENAYFVDDIDRYRQVDYWTAVRSRLYETP